MFDLSGLHTCIIQVKVCGSHSPETTVINILQNLVEVENNVLVAAVLSGALFFG